MVIHQNYRSASPSPSIDKHNIYAPSFKSSSRRHMRSIPSPQRYTATSSRHVSPEKTRLSMAADGGRRVDNSYDYEDGEPVCDYDTNATVLYELLESSTWERARARCRSHPDEVRTWIVRKDNSLAVRWKLLPLHASIIFQSPNYLVSALLDSYPSAASRKDDQGMLPLHLAFRHKREDEDLLELLLVKYPKAVLLKDKRGRVPLEHGRDSKFSAKLMRLYADAVTAGSRLVGKTNDVQEFTTSGLTTGERALIEKDHKEELEVIKRKYEKQIRQLQSTTTEQMNNIEESNGRRLSMLRQDYENQIRTLKEQYERKIERLHEIHQNQLNKIEKNSDEEKNAMANRHASEINEMRNMLAHQVDRDKELTEVLEKEIAHLQVALQERKSENDTTIRQNVKLSTENGELRDLLKSIQQQQLKFQELLSRQQDELKSEVDIRNQLISSLMKLDTEQGRTDNMLEMLQSVGRRVDNVLQQQEDNNNHNNTSPRASARHAADRDRLTVLPEDEAVEMLHRDRHLEKHSSRLDRVRGVGDEVEEKRSMLSRAGRVDEFRSPRNTKRTTTEEDEYGEVRILADEISAITDHSRF